MTDAAAPPARRGRRISWKLRVVVPLAIVILRMLASTWRVRKLNPEALEALRASHSPVVFSFWHGQMLPLMHAHRNENIHVMISEHADGETIARIARAFGFSAVRGSSTRGGIRALIGLVRAVREGRDVAITPDGPRGPARVFTEGVLLAAQHSAAPLVTIAAHADRAWRLRSWDAFVIPKPFSRVSVAYGAPCTIGAEAMVEAGGMNERFSRAMAETCALAGEP